MPVAETGLTWNLVDDELQRQPGLALRGFARVLAERGYETATYNPHLPWTDPDSRGLTISIRARVDGRKTDGPGRRMKGRMVAAHRHPAASTPSP